jgi:hypothetical protein
MTRPADRPHDVVYAPLFVDVDNSDGLTHIQNADREHDRTINLAFVEAAGGYQVEAWGDPDTFPADGRGRYQGRLDLSPRQIATSVASLRTAWNRELLGFQFPHELDPDRHPITDHVDLTGAGLTSVTDEVMTLLAREGYKLFRALFFTGDAGLREIGELLTAALRDRPQCIAVHSETLIVPWSMLYLPMDPGADLDGPGSGYTPDGFWGYRHLVEHLFKRLRDWSPDVVVRGRPRAGLNVDGRLDAEFGDALPVARVVEAFRQHCDVVRRESRPALAADLASADFADHMMYFGCHCQFVGEPGTAQAEIRLTDDLPINADDFRFWLNEHGLRTNPVVFMNTCSGGHFSAVLSTIGSELLRYGANCLLGPQVDVPGKFSAEYAIRVVNRMFGSGARLGPTVRDLAVEFMTTLHNPIGITMGLGRGIDSRFVVHPDQ